MKRFRIISPAKVNLRLDILEKRQDGYHELRTIFQKISLHDTLFFTLKEEKGVWIQTNHPDLPTGRSNLVFKAAHLILKRSHYKGGILIQIKKRIPVGAGLGGGSSNAAATLCALNQMLAMGLTQEELMEIGVKIGADVPFFLYKWGAAIGSGIGERLEKIELPLLFYVLIYPNFEVSSRWAYQNFLLTKKEFHFNLHQLLTTPQRISSFLWNDLEQVVSHRYQEIAMMKEMLLSVGALGSLMSGSGPTVFGIFSSEEASKKAKQKIKKKIKERGWKTFHAHSLV